MNTITQAMFEILAALAQQPLHGYAIAKRIAEGQGADAKPMGPATLYTTIQKLMTLGWIEEVDLPGGDARRGKSYRLTHSGMGQLAQETAKRRHFLDTIDQWMKARSAS